MSTALRNAKPLLDSFGVAHVSLFGSFARGRSARGQRRRRARLVQPAPRSVEFARLQRELGDRLGRRVELVTLDALKPQLRDRILGEAVIAA